MKVTLAFGIVFVCFFVYAVVDVKVITHTGNYRSALLSVWPIFFFFLIAPILIWWSYRIIYTEFNSKIWLTFLINSVLVYTGNLLGNYIASGQSPTKNQVIGLVLKGIGLVIASF